MAPGDVRHPIAVVPVLRGVLGLLRAERRGTRLENFDVLGAVLGTSAMLLLAYGLV